MQNRRNNNHERTQRGRAATEAARATAEYAKYARAGREPLFIPFPRIWRIPRFNPLSPTLSPLVPRRERETSAMVGVSRCALEHRTSNFQLQTSNFNQPATCDLQNLFVFIRVHPRLNLKSHLIAVISERIGRKIATAIVPTKPTRNRIIAGSASAKMVLIRRGTMSW